jgi:nicotinamide phosphoribosyltransferase
MKSTYCEVGEYKIPIFKDPITDDGTKKSARGIPAVYKDEHGEYYLKEGVTMEELMNCELKPVFKDGVLLKDFTLQEVRNNVKSCK